MRIASLVVVSSLPSLPCVVTSFVVFGCQPQTPSSPDAEAAASTDTASVTPAAPSPEEAAQAEAQKRAEDWLALVDGGQYDASWDAAAAAFQSAVTKDQWQQSVQAARAPLGTLSSRQFRAAEYKTSIPGAPEGKYVVVYYDSGFAQKPTARETVTLRQAEDGLWKVAGYFVQ